MRLDANMSTAPTTPSTATAAAPALVSAPVRWLLLLATWPLATTTYVYYLRLLYESLICHSLIINQYCLTAVLRSI
jgi:hypothetical protein